MMGGVPKKILGLKEGDGVKKRILGWDPDPFQLGLF